MIYVSVSTNPDDVYAMPVGKFSARKLAFREAKRAAGEPHSFVIRGKDKGYSGPNGMAWIIE
jgi:hypothetical protein